MSEFSVKRMKRILGRVLGILLCSTTVFANPVPALLTIDMSNVPLQDALHTMAKFLNLNMMMSPSLQGLVNMHMHDAVASDVLALLLKSQQLSAVYKGRVMYISSQVEFIKNKEEEFKLEQMLNEATPLQTEVWQVRYAKAEDLARLLQENNHSLFSARGQVHVDMRTNTLCVQDLPERLARIHVLLQKLDVPVQQVLIEARLVSIDSDYERNLGLDFSMHEAKSEGGAYAQPTSGLTRLSVAMVHLADGVSLDATLSALERDGKGELISSPSLFTANQKTAAIEAGEEIPYQEVSRSGSTGVAFKKAVLSLRVTPQIMPGSRVLLQLQVNQDKPSSRIVLGVPAISTRQMSTNIMINNGQTLVLGGIYERNEEHDQQGIPGFHKIPLVGWLFHQQNDKVSKRELLVFVTPHIMT